MFKLVYLDFSKTSQGVAKTRARYRGLTNIAWEHDTIERIPHKNLGTNTLPLISSFVKLKLQGNLTL